MRRPNHLATITDESQVVLIQIDREDFDAMIELDTELHDLLAASDFACHDGHESGGGETDFWSYGTDAEKLFLYMESTLQNSAFATGCRVTLRFGDHGTPKRTFTLVPYQGQRPDTYLAWAARPRYTHRTQTRGLKARHIALRPQGLGHNR